MTRRSFMKWMGAGAALMGIGLPACRRIEKYLVPYHQSPEWTIPGVETAYATCQTANGITHPLLAACYEGRPVKLISSRQYPGGPGLSATTQASILELYDPGRSKHILFHGNPVSADEFRGAFSSWSSNLRNSGKIGILLPTTNSPLIQNMTEEMIRKNPDISIYQYSPVPVIGSGMQAALPKDIRFRVRFPRAKRILALDCDFLHTNPYGNTEDFIAARSPEGLRYQGGAINRARLYAVEGRISLTGAHADHRLSLLPSRLSFFLKELLRYISAKKNASTASTPSPQPNNPLTEKELVWLHHCADDLLAHPGESIILLGDNHPELSVIVWQLNSILGSIGSSIQLLQARSSQTLGNLTDFIRDTRNGKIEIVFLLNAGNPVLDSEYGAELKKALNEMESIHLGMYEDETSRACRWHLPSTHFLESWGVEQDNRGRFCYRQPVILPLYGGISTEEILSGLLSSKGKLITADNSPNHLSPIYHRARKCFERSVNPENKTSAWTQALQRGYSEETAYPALSPQQEGDISHALAQPAVTPSDNRPQTTGEELLELQFYPDYSIGDGSWKRNAWMQECPDPITGVSWAASAQIAPTTLRRLGGTENAPMRCTLSAPYARMEVILCPIPGVAENLIILPLGYGGINPIAEDQSQSAGYRFRNGLSTQTRRHLAATQITLAPLERQHEAIQSPLIHPDPLSHSKAPTTTPFTPPQSDTVYQWKMAIDTDRCIGCNACLIACRAENNIPIVGRTQMAKGRALDWIRIDKYFTEDGTLTAIPIACQQCGKAPCESVCPVNATVHTSEGLNAMVYARCWGTRYCAANCPYKARRFNFFDYAKASEQATRLQRNPNVTVRSRGVMEKCTYCVQMVERAKIQHRSRLMKKHPGEPSVSIHVTEKDLFLPDGAAQTACQLVCPMGAITFGNIKNTDSIISRTKSLSRHRDLLAGQGTAPSTGYLIPVRNPNPAMVEKKS